MPSALKLSAVVLIAACASSPEPRRLERLPVSQLQARLQAETTQAPGVVFGAVWRDGASLVRVAGAADLRTGRKLEATAPMAWFSITKLFTATAVMQLAERGLVDLDAPVSRYLPEVRLRRAGQEATVRDLLTHTSGLPNPLPVRWVHLATEPGPGLDDMIRRRVGAEPRLKSVPGMKRAYSNLGFLLLGQIVERVSGERYQDYVETHVLAPLGCTASGYAVPPEAATGYQRKWSLGGFMSRFMFDRRLLAGSVGGYWDLRPLTVDGAPYGGLFGPADCLLSLASMMMHEGQGRNGPVLSPASVKAMLEPSRTRDGRVMGIGLAWQLGAVGEEPYAAHQGGGGGYKAEVRLYPRLGYAVAVLGNESGFDTDPLARVLVVPSDSTIATR